MTTLLLMIFRTYLVFSNQHKKQKVLCHWSIGTLKSGFDSTAMTKKYISKGGKCFDILPVQPHWHGGQ